MSQRTVDDQTLARAQEALEALHQSLLKAGVLPVRPEVAQNLLALSAAVSALSGDPMTADYWLARQGHLRKKCPEIRRSGPMAGSVLFSPQHPAQSATDAQ